MFMQQLIRVYNIIFSTVSLCFPFASNGYIKQVTLKKIN